MFQNLMQQLTSGQVDQSQIEQGAAEHVNSMDHNELQGHLQTAANNAQQSGQSGFAQQIMGLLSSNSGNPQGLRGGVVNLITQNPQILERFAPGFAQGILQRVL